MCEVIISFLCCFRRPAVFRPWSEARYWSAAIAPGFLWAPPAWRASRLEGFPLGGLPAWRASPAPFVDHVDQGFHLSNSAGVPRIQLPAVELVCHSPPQIDAVDDARACGIDLFGRHRRKALDQSGLRCPRRLTQLTVRRRVAQGFVRVDTAEKRVVRQDARALADWVAARLSARSDRRADERDTEIRERVACGARCGGCKHVGRC
jgi:hypothetical protein